MHSGPPYPPSFGSNALPMPNGSILNGRYQIQRVIGSGSFGRVYLASDIQDTKSPPVAIKELLDGQFKTPQDRQEAVTWFKREVSTLLALEHPAIPAIHGYWTAHHTAGPLYLAMDYIPGKTLEAVLQEVGGRVNWRVAVVWGIALCDVLAYLHARTPPFVFRDMKLQNVMVDSRTSHPVLIDFGITRQLGPNGGTAIGTWGYVPYEQILGRAEPRSDVYALGATLHAMLTGIHPDMEYARLLRSRLSIEDAMRLLFPPVDTIVPDIPLAVAQVVSCATSFDTAKRYTDAVSLADALKQALQIPNQPMNIHQQPKGRTSSSSLPPKTAAGSSPPSPASAQAYMPTTTPQDVAHGGLRIQVQSFKAQSDAYPIELQPGFMYYILRLLISNTGTMNCRYEARAFKLQGVDSVIYSPHIGGFAWSHSVLEDGILAPGNAVAGDILFDVPANQQYQALWTLKYPSPPIIIKLQ